MKFVLIILPIWTSHLSAKSSLDQMMLGKLCLSGGCTESAFYKESFRNIRHQVVDNPQNMVTIKTAEVLKKDESDHNKFFLKLTLFHSNSQIKNQQDSNQVVLYRHQVLSSHVKFSDDKQNMIAKVFFDKKMELSEINKICQKLTKTCKWKSELDPF